MLYTIILLLLLILLFNTSYLFIFSAAGAMVKSKSINSTTIESFKNMLVIFPGYKEDAVIIGAAKSVLGQQYPSGKFKCVVLADAFQPSTILQLKSEGVQVFELPDDEKRNKARSIQLFLASCKERYDACIILDADNCVEPNMLLKVNQYLHSGATIIQARRVAKNEESNLSRLDALSEIINNHIFRKGQRALGMSSSLIGSGMIIEMNLFRKLMENMQVISGFDKELELRILKNKLTIEYAEDIKIYDEKVSHHEVYVNQRRRWTYAQIYFLKKNFFNAFRELFKNGNSDYFNKVIQFALLPRIMCLGISFLIIPVAAFVSTALFIASLINALLVSSSILIALKGALKTKELIGLAGRLPSAFTGMLMAVITSGKASGKFIHTPHNIN